MALEDRLEAEIPITGADFPIVAFDAVWVVSAETEPAVVRVNPKTNEVVAEILVPGRGCNGMTAGFDSIWACASDGIARIDPVSNSVVTVISVDAVGQARLAAGAGSVWAFTRTGDGLGADSVLRVDPGSNNVGATTQLGHQLGTMAFGFDALWVTSPADGLLLRVDPTTNEVTTAVEGLEGPFVVTVGPDGIWISLYGTDAHPEAPAGEPTIIRVDPATGEVTASIATDPIGRSGGIAVDDDSIWVRSAGDFLTHVDPITMEVVEVITASKGGGDIVLGFGSVWTSSWDFHQIWRVSPRGP